MNMQIILIVTTVVDLVAVGVLGYLMVRGARDREQSLGEQRAALEALRRDLAVLLEEAEQRAGRLDGSLAKREASLRALVGELGRVEGHRHAATTTVRQEVPLAKGLPVMPLTARDVVESRDTEKNELDPAEARFLRELEASLPPRTA